jgi:hypothetical protein
LLKARPTSEVARRLHRQRATGLQTLQNSACGAAISAPKVSHQRSPAPCFPKFVPAQAVTNPRLLCIALSHLPTSASGIPGRIGKGANPAPAWHSFVDEDTHVQPTLGQLNNDLRGPPPSTREEGEYELQYAYIHDVSTR